MGALQTRAPVLDQAAPVLSPQARPGEISAAYQMAYDRRMTAAEAGAWLDVPPKRLTMWANGRGLIWHRDCPPGVRFAPHRAAPLLDMAGPYDDSDLDPAACRKLWCSVLVEQFKVLQGILVAGEAEARAYRQRQAVLWFDTHEAAAVATLAGVDDAKMRAAARRIAARRWRHDTDLDL